MKIIGSQKNSPHHCRSRYGAYKGNVTLTLFARRDSKNKTARKPSKIKEKSMLSSSCLQIFTVNEKL